MESKKSNSLIRSIFGYSLGSWFSAVLSFIVVPISSHLYTEADLGKINFFISVGSVVYMLLCLGLDQGYIRFYVNVEEEKGKKQLLSFDMIVVFLALLILTGLAALFWRPIGMWLFGEADPLLLAMLPCYLAGLLVIRFFSVLYRMRNKLLSYTVFTVLLSLCTKGVYLLSAPMDRSYRTAIIFSGGVAVGLCLIILLAQSKELCLPGLKKNSTLYIKQLLFSLPLIPSVLMSLLNNNIPQFMLRSFGGFSYVAGYSVAVTVATALNVVQSGFNTFWTPYVFKNHDTNQHKIKQMHGYIVTFMPLLGILIVLFQNAIFLVVNRDYTYITQFLPFLILTPLCYTIGETTCVGIALKLKTSLNIVIYGVCAAINALLCVLLIPRIGVNGAAISAGAGAIAALILKTFWGQRLYSSVESLFPMISNIALFVAIAFANMLLQDSVIRYPVLIGCLILFLLLPHNRKLFKSGIGFLAGFLNKNKTNQ